jgi:hypothetical protein
MLLDQLRLEPFALLFKFGISARKRHDFLLKVDNLAVSVEVGHWQTRKDSQAYKNSEPKPKVAATNSSSVLAFASHYTAPGSIENSKIENFQIPLALLPRSAGVLARSKVHRLAIQRKPGPHAMSKLAAACCRRGRPITL